MPIITFQSERSPIASLEENAHMLREGHEMQLFADMKIRNPDWIMLVLDSCEYWGDPPGETLADAQQGERHVSFTFFFCHPVAADKEALRKVLAKKPIGEHARRSIWALPPELQKELQQP